MEISKAKKGFAFNLWTLIVAEIAVSYGLIYVSAWLDWPWHQYFRFLTLIPIYQAGAAYGFGAAVISATIVSVLFFPVLRIDRAIYAVPRGMPTGVAMIVFINIFGVFVGGIIGRSKKTHLYMRKLSAVTIRIASETDERSVMLRLAREAMDFVSAAHAAALVYEEGKQEPREWRMYGLSPEAEVLEIKEFDENHPLVWAARERKALLSGGAASDPRFASHPEELPGAPAIAAPVVSGADVYGSLFLYSREDEEIFSPKDFAIAQALCGAAGNAINNIRQERARQEKKAAEERMGALFSKFVSTQVAEYILDNPDALKSRWQEVTLLVSDIRDFTRLSEEMDPEALVKQLNEYFTAMVDVIFDNGGAVDKFIGDCVVAYWGAPAPDERHALRAAHAAFGMAAALDKLNSAWAAEGRPQFSSGIALHTCGVLMGNIGNESKKAFTLVGEEVGAAMEIEALTKEYGERIIASSRTCEAARGTYAVEKLPPSEKWRQGDLFAMRTA